MARHLRADVRSLSSLCGRELSAKEIEEAVLALNARTTRGLAGFRLCGECLVQVKGFDQVLEAIQR